MVRETTDARKVRLDRKAVRALLKDADEVVAMRGRSLVRSDAASLSDEVLERLVLGPTKNLRAPAARIGRTLLVGFDERTWASALA